MAACLLLIVGTWTRVAVQSEFERSEAIGRAIQRNDNLAVAFEQYVVRTIDNADAVLQAVRREYMHRGHAADIRRLISDLGPGDEAFVAAGVLDERGALVQSTLAGAADPDQASHPELTRFHQHADSQQESIGRPVRSPSSGAMSITISRRIDKIDGEFGGVVFVSMGPARFTDFYREARLQDSDLLTQAGMDGIVLARRAGNRQTSGDDLRKAALFIERAKHPVGCAAATPSPGSVATSSSSC